MTEGTLLKWLKKEGESFRPGDALCEIQTDKAVVAFEVEDEGILARILVPEDTKDIKLGTVIAIMVEEGENWENVLLPAQDPESASTPSIQKGKLDPCDTLNKSSETTKLCGPSVRNLLQEYGIKYSLITPTGPHNVLLKGDVLQYISSNKLKPSSEKVQEISAVPDITFVEKEDFIDIPHTSMRQVIARRLTESKTTIPHAYMSINCSASEVTKLRTQMKNGGIAVSVNDFIIKCAAEALAKVPEVNIVHCNEKAKKVESVDISVAVATNKGLITPIIKNANTLNVQQISDCVKALAMKAREGRLKPEEYQGGSFSISNLGMFGISEFAAVINPPQGAILAVGTSRLVLDSNCNIVPKITVTLSFDGRIIEDSDAARFLHCFKEHLENPFAIVAGIPIKHSEPQKL